MDRIDILKFYDMQTLDMEPEEEEVLVASLIKDSEEELAPLISASTVFARVDRKIALVERVVLASARMVEFANPCQHAPYPEGRTCDVGNSGEHKPSGSSSGSDFNPFESLLEDSTPSPEAPRPTQSTRKSGGGYDMTGGGNGADVQIHKSVGPPVVSEYTSRFDTGSNPYGDGKEGRVDNPWTAEQPFGPDYDKKGKPWPGSNEWLAAHGVSREVFDNRPFTRFEQGSTAEIQSAYGTPEALAPYVGSRNPTSALDMMLAISTGKGSSEGTGGFIQNRSAVDSEIEAAHGGPPIAQIRPDVAVVINPSKRAYRQKTLDNAKKNLEIAASNAALSPSEGKAAAVAKQEERVAAAIKWHETVTTTMTSPEEILKNAVNRNEAAKLATSVAIGEIRDAAKAAGEPVKTKGALVTALKNDGIGLSERELALAPLFQEQNRAAKALDSVNKDVGRWEKNPGSFEVDQRVKIGLAERGIETAKAKLQRYKDSPAESQLEDRTDSKGNPVLDKDGVTMKKYSQMSVVDSSGNPVLDKNGKARTRDAVSPQDNELDRAKATVATAQGQFDKSAIKYAFPPTPKDENGYPIKGKGTAARVELQQDAQNVANFKDLKTNGRVYLAMEGSIKGSAILTALKEQDPTASVIAVPSVTLWRPDGSGKSEMQDVAEKYLRGREVVLIPDADGVNNVNVRNESRAMHAMLQNAGAKVVVASPPIPIKENGKPETDATGKVHLYESTLGSGKTEELKGADDWLGAGRFSNDPRLGSDKGTLGGMVYRDRVVPVAHIDADFVDQRTKTSDRAMVKALSLLAGDSGSVKVSAAMLHAASGLPRSTAQDTLDRLVKTGAVRVEQVYNPDLLKQGIRSTVMDQDRVDLLVRAKVISRPNDDEFVETNGPESFVYTLTNPDHISHDAKFPVPLSKGFPTTKAPERVAAPAKKVQWEPATPPATPAAKARVDLIRKVKDLVAEGKTKQEIADELGISPASVYNHIKASAAMDDIGFGLYYYESEEEEE